MNNKLKKFLSENEMPLNFVRFYAVGLGLFFLPWTRPIFIAITPVTLLLVFSVVFWFHKKWNLPTILAFIFIAVASYYLEVAGTQTGKIFGAYTYGTGLGLKISETPLMIGLNWLFLIYATHGIVSEWFSKPVFKIFAGAALMILYDLVIEFAAPAMDMWQFSGATYPPIHNFISWFLASVVFHAVFVLARVETENKSARSLYVIQLGFFVILTIFIQIFF